MEVGIPAMGAAERDSVRAVASLGLSARLMVLEPQHRVVLGKHSGTGAVRAVYARLDETERKRLRGAVLRQTKIGWRTGRVREAILAHDDLRRARRIWFINSLRGAVAVEPSV